MRGALPSSVTWTNNNVDVAARARELGCRVPVGIALLPGNFFTARSSREFFYHVATPHIRRAWQSVGLDDEGPGTVLNGPADRDIMQSDWAASFEAAPSVLVSRRARTVREFPNLNTRFSNAGTQFPLVTFFGTGLLGGPAWCLAVALSMVSRVLALHPSCACPREVRLDAIVERRGGNHYACLAYRGDAYELVALARDVRGIWNG